MRAFASYSRTIRGGNSRTGCMAKYEAKAVARMKVKLAPWDAFAMAVRMKRLVRAEVERAMQVATVKGLNKKPAAMAALLHRRSFRGEVKRRVAEAKPVSAIWASALALSRSTRVKKTLVASGAAAALGSKAKSGSRRGAWW